MFTLDAGAFSLIEFDPVRKTVTLTVTAAPEGVSGAASAPQGRLVVTQTAQILGVHLVKPSGSFKQDASAWLLPFTNGSTIITFV